ncbi:MAG: winged helix-turn-helix transcriptional regulator [Myxococcota bacterium]
MDGFRYEQFCPLARSAELLGERWTLLIVRELFCGPQRFSDLLRRLPGLSTSVLAQRLERMLARGLVARVDEPPPTPAALYRLTADGEALRPVLRELMRFGVRYLDPSKPEHLEPEWIGLGLEAFARSGPTPRRTIALRLPGGVCLRIRGGRSGTRVETGAGPAEVTLRAEPMAVLGLATGLVDPVEAVRSGAIAVEGDARLLRDLPRLFEVKELMTREAPTG